MGLQKIEGSVALVTGSNRGIGRAFVTNYLAEIGDDGLKTIRSIKNALDPNKIMNPGIFGLHSKLS